jgi:hypothetical protein
LNPPQKPQQQCHPAIIRSQPATFFFKLAQPAAPLDLTIEPAAF